MSSFGVANVAGINLQDRIPESSKLVANAIDVQSVVVSRRQAKFNANNGTTFNPSEVPNFSIQSNSEFMIPSTAVLHYKLKNTTKTNAGNQSITACFDDLGTCIINRATARISGVQVEDTLDVNKSINVLAYSHMNPEHYNHEAGINLKAWKWVKGYESNKAGTATAASNPPTQAQATQAIVASNSQRLDGTGVTARQLLRAGVEVVEVEGANVAQDIEVNIPLSYIFGLFRSNKLFPLAFLSELKLEFLLESAVKAVFSTAANDVANYQVNDLYITCDMVNLSSEYLRVLQASFNAGEEMGYTLPVQTLSTAPQTTPAGGAQDLTFSKSTPFLKGIYFRLAQSSWDAAVNQYSISGQSYQLAANPDLRLRVGSKAYPEYDSLHSAEEIYRNNCIAMSQFSNVADAMGLTNEQTLKGADSGNGTMSVYFSFEKVSGLGSDYYAMDSMDASLAGGVITLHADFEAGTQALAIFEHTRVVRMGDRRVDVRG